MTTAEQKVSPTKKDAKVSPRAETLIGEIRSLWSTTQTSYMKMGEHFSHLRAETERYQASDRTGISYAEAVRRTGVPRSTAEFYRRLYETCADFNISTAIFLALQDSGVNLAGERYQDHETRELRKVNVQELRKLDVSDHASVKALADKLKADNPIEKTPKEGIRKQVIGLQAGILKKRKSIEQTKETDYKRFLQTELKKDEESLLSLQLQVIRQLVELFDMPDISVAFKDQQELRPNLWEFILNAGKQALAAADKMTKKEK